MNKKKNNIITPRDVDFSQWYTDVILNADLISYGPVKGTMFLKPYGYSIWENIRNMLDKNFKKINIMNVYFPSLIPKSLFSKEKQHINGFSPEVMTVTKIGDKKIDEELCIRPTSEVLFGIFFSKVVQGYNDLPILYNQWVNAFRWEKTTRPFLRTSEFLWQEGHTVHANAYEAKKFALKILSIYGKFASEVLLLPVIKGKKTDSEKFAGALETYTIESLMYDGQVLQCGTSHYFGQNFTRVFNVKFNNKNNKFEYAYSTSWGLSTRIIGAIIMVHGDDKGLVLPPLISPIQIIIILVNNSSFLLEKAFEIKNMLKNYRVVIDSSNKSFGYKIINAEIKGIPLRIEFGLNDLRHGCVTVVRRDNFKKIKVKISDVLQIVKESIVEINKILYIKALNNQKKYIVRINTLDEYKENLKSGNKLILAPFCGRICCENEIKLETQTVSRCIFSIIREKRKCFMCNLPSELLVYFGRAY